MTLNKCDGRANVPPDVQAMIDETNKSIERSRQLIRATDANLRSRADWHEHIAQDDDGGE
jgi:ParB-like chromosome segregation protein Spo0J